jgi:aubergine
LIIWPGYVTAVHEYEDGLYLVVDVIHRVLRSENCRSLMSDFFDASRGDMDQFRQRTTNEIVGNVVLTRYNNKSYRVDDILWDQNPMNLFTLSDGTQTSYAEYYKQHYSIDISDLKQPLLLHRAKKRGNIPGQEEKINIICLIPELCYLTDISADAKKDFKISKELAMYTRLSPDQRIEQLRQLLINIRECPAALQEITNWGLELDQDFTPVLIIQ